MKILLDTHFLIWTLLGSSRLRHYPWIAKYQPWGVSPVSLLELQFLSEVGKVSLTPGFATALGDDPRFVIDEPQFLALVDAAMDLSSTRDPFDRLIAAHSEIRRVPLCTADTYLLEHHRYLPRELRRSSAFTTAGPHHS